ncbi:uncharacterized protein [Hoplias malabaricus]|uniref:uncharacterized protein n=1 Tax=Hoplias malabaricus TaxID=27720 RepID=UPI0034620A97
MAPKKPPVTQTRSEEEECESTTVKGNTSEITNLQQMLESFFSSQQQRDEELRGEATKQEQRWRSLQHQFGLLQEEVRRGQSGVQQHRETEHSTTASHTIYRPATPAVSAYDAMGEQLRTTQVAWPRLPQLKDDDDIEHYFIMFERLALAARWPKTDWAFHLVPLLEGKARAAYVAMSVEQINDFEAVKEAILRRFEINPETYRQRFRKGHVLNNETPRELFTRLTGLYERWIRPKDKTKEDIGQTIVLEQFLSVINPELKSWILERSPTSAEQAVEMAEAFIAARQAEGEFQLGKSTFTKQTSKFERRDYGSGVERSKPAFKMQWHKSIKSSAEKPKIRCFSCNQIGHKSSECQYPPTSSNQLCYTPRKENPFSTQECNDETTVTVKLNGKQFRALLDTGASQTLVTQACLENSQYSLTGTLKVRCIHGDEQIYPTTEINISIKGQSYLVRVGVVQNSPYPIILGRDIPILIDLLNYKNVKTAEAMVVTRQSKKNLAKETTELFKELPYAAETKKKTRRDVRKAKVMGTKCLEKIELPDTDNISLPINFEQLQNLDETLKPLFEKSKHYSDISDKGCHLAIKDNKLYRITDKGEQLVLPVSLREKVLKMGHSDPWAGHFGQAKTFSRIAYRFYWPGQYADVIKYCNNCPECQLTATLKKSDKVPMVSMPIIDIPFSRIAMDVVGPLPRTKNGNRYILVICDYATKYPEAFALKNIKTRQIVNALIQLISRVGIPKEILTDRGTNFTSKQIKQVYDLLGIKSIHTTPYHPQTDGLTERFNKTLKQALQKVTNNNGTDWDMWLPYVLFAYREVPQASTGFSPFELLYGRQVRGPMDVLKEAWEGEKSEQKLNILTYVLKIRDKLSQLTSTVHENMEKAQVQQKHWYDKVARKRVLQIGQKVLILLPTSDTGLLAKWQGPYKVQRQVGETTYELHLPDRRKKFQSFHINMLRPWKEPENKSSEQLWIRAVHDEDEVAEQYFPTRNEGFVLPKVPHLTSQQQQELLHVVPPKLFSDEPGLTDVTQHNVRLIKDEPIRQFNCRVPARLVPELKKEVEAMIKMGVIEPSKSEWCSPVVLVPKKDGGLRFCIDFSKLNALSAFDPYPMPRADDLIERLGKAKVLSTVDLCKGYWQVPLSQSAKELTAFRTPSGLYHFRAMPFGLHGAAATFQRLMDDVLRGTEDFAAAYIDDVVIYSSSWEEHLQHLGIVLRKIADAGLTANPSKCHLAREEVSYLGYILGGGQIRPQVDKVEAVRATPQPNTKRRVRSFLGLVGWYRRFIPNFSTKAAALTDLTKKDMPQRVKWTETCEYAFKDLKNALCQEPVLASPDFSKPFIVQTDASGTGLGAVLLQGEDDERKPILYISRKLFPRETNYSTIEKEALAIKWALDSLKYYLLGHDFVLETDHKALQWIQRMKDSNARITRWYLSLQPYRFTIRYRKGTHNVTADYLSRRWEGVELKEGGV